MRNVCFWHDRVMDTQEKRQTERYPIVLRVRSSDLAAFQAVSSDISETGLQMKTGKPVAVGSQLALQIDLERDFGVLECRGTVRWCLLGREIRIGLAFAPLDTDNLVRFRRFLAFRQDELRKIMGDEPAKTGRAGEPKRSALVSQPLKARVQSAQLQDEGLVLGLTTEGELVEWLFPNAELLEFNPGNIATLAVRASDRPHRLVYNFQAENGLTVVRIIAPADQEPRQFGEEDISDSSGAAR